MTIPKYVEEIMRRSYPYYDFELQGENADKCAVGYTVSISKKSIYTHVETFNSEIERLKAWVERQKGGACHIVSLPKETHYGSQYAIVTIYDPVMQHLQWFIHP